MNYDELVKALRNSCESCKLWDGYKCCLKGDCTGQTLLEAADAIETLDKWWKKYSAYVVLPGEAHFQPKWIPVTERLPEDGEAVNVVWVNHSPVIYYQHIKDRPQTATGVHFNGHWYWWSAVVQDYLAEYGEWDCDKMDEAIEVTHWMPLPSTEGLNG